MNEVYPSKLLERTVGEFSKLPGIGRRTALRLVLHLLRQKPETGHALSESLSQLIDGVKYCKVCHNISDTDICDICSNPLRDQSTVCVVENIRNVLSIENTGIYRGLYHVLGGVISPMLGIGPADLRTKELFTRLGSQNVDEVILATGSTVEGEATAIYLSKLLKPLGVRVTRIANGVPVGGDLEYVDEMTLARALEGRTEI